MLYQLFILLVMTFVTRWLIRRIRRNCRQHGADQVTTWTLMIAVISFAVFIMVQVNHVFLPLFTRYGEVLLVIYVVNFIVLGLACVFLLTRKSKSISSDPG